MQRKAKILIVDDEAILAASMERELARRGYATCESACSEMEALEKVKGERPDLIVMDCCLSSENDGFVTARHLRSFCDAPIVFMSGLSRTDIADHLDTIPKSSFLAKPFNPDDLARVIETTLETYGQPAV